MFLLCVVFNLYHENIHHPLQGLAAFFAEYKNFDWANMTVTLQGPAHQSEMESTWSNKANANHVVKEKVLHKYVSVYDPNRLAYSSTGKTAAGQLQAAAEQAEEGAAEATITASAAGGANVGVIGPPPGMSIQTPSPEEVPNIPLLNTRHSVTSGRSDNSGRSSFQRRAMHILHPFYQTTNMAVESIDAPHVDVLRSVLHTAADNLQHTLANIAQYPQDANMYTGLAMLNKYFYSGLIGKYGSDYIRIVTSHLFTPENMPYLLGSQVGPLAGKSYVSLDETGKICSLNAPFAYMDQMTW